VSLAQLSYLMRRKLLRQSAAYAELGTRRWVIHPEETRARRSAVYFDDEIDRISTRNVGSTTYAYEMSRLQAGHTQHDATVAHLLENVDLVNGSLYKGAMRHRLVASRSLISRAQQDYMESGALACTLYGNTFFGHWMSDDLSLHLAAESFAAPVAVDRPLYHHEPDYCELMRINSSKVARVRFGQLTILDDIGQNTYKQRRYEQLRSRLRASVAAAGNRLVYIRRGRKAAKSLSQRDVSRTMTNADEVEAYLGSQGFVTVDLDQCSAPQIAAAILDAVIVVGTEGSHMAHALYSIRDHGALCILQAPDCFTNVFKDYADCIGLRYGFTAGVRGADGFSIQIRDLERIIDRLIDCTELRA
jgi:capsular polysaccharide biosynthesis protein